MRRNIAIHVLLVVVLLFNGPATPMAWAGGMHGIPEAQSFGTMPGGHSHCAEMAGMSVTPDTGAPSGRSSGHHDHSSACCSAGACHCGSMSLSADAVVAAGQTRLLVSYIASSYLDAPLSPIPARHFRPPII